MTLIGGDDINSILVKLDVLDDNRRRLRSISQNMSSIQSQFLDIKSSLDYEVKRRSGIEEDMRSNNRELSNIVESLSNAADFAESTKRAYEDAEKQISQLSTSIISDGESGNHNGTMLAINNIGSIRGYRYSADNFISVFSNRYRDTETNIYDYHGEYINSDLLDYISHKELLELKENLIEILNDISQKYNGAYPSFEMDDDLSINKDFDQLIEYFFLIYEETATNNNIRFRYSYNALPDKYKLRTLIYWTRLILDGYEFYEIAREPMIDDFYFYMPSPPRYDSELGRISSRNKYKSKAAFEYFKNYIYPQYAMYDFYEGLGPQYNHMYNIWMADTYDFSTEHKRIIELANSYSVNNIHEWTSIDIAKWLSYGGDEFLQEFEDKWIDGYSEVINGAAKEYDIPPYLLAGVLKVELGGDPLWIDPMVYKARKHLPNFLKLLPKLRVDKDKTSFGNASIQVRRAGESLGYPADLTDIERELIIDSLSNSKEAIFICAKHISDLRDVDFKGISAENLTEEQIRIIGSRYNVGPDIKIDEVPIGYGKIITDIKDDLEELLK